MESNEVLGKHGRARGRVIRISRSDETRDRFLLAIPLAAYVAADTEGTNVVLVVVRAAPPIDTV